MRPTLQQAVFAEVIADSLYVFGLLVFLLIMAATCRASSLTLPPQGPIPPQAPPMEVPRALTYSEARLLALRENKPLVVWVGGNFCEQCVKDAGQEFIHVFVADGWEGNAGPMTVVGLPEDGEMWKIGMANWWEVGSKTHGHIPTVRRIIANWRANRRMMHQHAPGAAVSYSSSSFMMRSSYSGGGMMSAPRRGG